MSERKIKISVVMIVKNAEGMIREVLESVRGWADEIIVVDDESKDNTVSIVKEYTDKIFIRKMDLEGKQRNYTTAQAKNEWVLWLDADERLTEELKKEIDQVLSSTRGEMVAYWIPRKNFLGKKWLRYGGWYPAPHIKLYNKKFVRWKEVNYDVVHPGIEIEKGCKGGTLKNHLIHYNFKDIEDFITKVNRQTTLEALKWFLMGKKITIFRGIWKGFERFWKRYIQKKGYKDGFYGFISAFLSASYQWIAYLKYREILLNRVNQNSKRR